MSGSTVAFVGSYGSPDAPTISAVSVDGDGLTLLGGRPGVANPSFLAATPDGRYLLAVSETGLAADGSAGEVHSFAIDHTGDGPALSHLGAVPSEGDHPCHLGVHPGGRWVAVSNYGSGTVAVLPLGSDGALGTAACTVRHDGRGPNERRQRGPHAHSSVFTPDGRHLISANLGADRVVVSAFDERTGELGDTSDAVVAPGAGPRHVAVAPDGGDVFVANELDCTVTWYSFDEGALTARQTLPTVPDDAPETLVAEIVLDAPRSRLVVSNRGHDSLAVFGFDADHGLTPVDEFPCGGAWPRHFAVLPDAERLVVANERSDRLDLLRLDGTSVASLSMPSPTCVVPVG